MKENILVEKHGKMGSQLLTERKLAELIDAEKRLV